MTEKKGSRVFAAIKNDRFLVDQMISSDGWSTLPLIGNTEDTVETNSDSFISGGSSVQFNKVSVEKTESWFMKILDNPISIIDYIGGKVSFYINSELLRDTEITKVNLAFVSNLDIMAQEVVTVEIPIPSNYVENHFTHVEGYLPEKFNNNVDLRNIIGIGVGIKTANATDVGYFIISELSLEALVSQDTKNNAATRKINGTVSGATTIVDSENIGKIHEEVVKRLFVVNNDTDPGYVQVFFDGSTVDIGVTTPDLVFPLAASSYINEEIDFDASLTGFTIAVTTTPTGSTELSPVPSYCVLLGDV